VEDEEAVERATKPNKAAEHSPEIFAANTEAGEQRNNNADNAAVGFQTDFHGFDTAAVGETDAATTSTTVGTAAGEVTGAATIFTTVEIEHAAAVDITTTTTNTRKTTSPNRKASNNRNNNTNQ
jgi:hypothetical protein